MEAVGYDLYCKMLNEAVKKCKGEEVPEEEYETSVEIKVDAFIPVSYIKNEFQKLDIYKRIAELETEDEKTDMIDELVDRFGEPPKSVMNLLNIAILKAKAHEAFIMEVASKKSSFSLRCIHRRKLMWKEFLNSSHRWGENFVLCRGQNHILLISIRAMCFRRRRK